VNKAKNEKAMWIKVEALQETQKNAEGSGQTK
jgi:hypothetical protein